MKQFPQSDAYGLSRFACALRSAAVRVLITLALVMTGSSAVLAAGFLQLRNFSHDDYNGGPQNWAFAQDSIGRVYIGNRDGMLSFDGERWRKFPLANGTTVRALLYVAPEDRIYASGTDEFGYFESEPETGILRYKSLRRTVPSNAPSFTEIWHIHRLGGKLYFQADNYLLCYDGKQTSFIKSPGRISTSALIDGTVYVGLENGTLLYLSGHSLLQVKGAEALLGKRIQAILPGLGKFLVATPVDGLFHYIDGRIEPLGSDINSFLKENQLFCGTSDGQTFAFGTVTRGVVIKNFTTGMTRYVNRESGMLNNTVLNAAFDRAGNIWLGLDNGLDYIFFNSPVSTLVGPGNDIGAGYASLRRGPKLFLGTNQGLYSTLYPFSVSPEPIKLAKELQGQIWSMTDMGDSFFVAGDGGMFVNEGGGFYKIAGLGGGYRIRPVVGQPDLALAACYDGFHLLSRSGGRWQKVGDIPGNQGIQGDFVIDRHGNVWVHNWLKGLYRLHFDADLRRFDNVRLYDKESGAPEVNGNSIIDYKGEMVYSNEDGFYMWSPSTDKFVLHPQLNSLLQSSPRATLYSNGRDGLALLDRRGIQVSTVDSAGVRRKSSVTLRGFRSLLVNGFEHVNILSPAEVLLSTQNGFWLINSSSVSSVRQKHIVPFVNTVVANMDSIVYRAPLNGANANLKLPFGIGSLRFEFGYPDYVAPSELAFSTFLENYEKDWSPYSVEASREYTQLKEGQYIMHIRVKNQNTGEVEESEFRFTVTPPWYRSVAAIICYVILSLLAIGLIVWLTYRWKLRAEREVEREKEEELMKLRRQAEQEALQKDYEIASLKSEQLEIDIKHKSGELSTATMNLIRKNEILTDLGSKISKIQSTEKLDPGVRRQLEQLQAKIHENISHDDVWTDFNRNFDIVYQNYTKRLHEQYPQLTASDIRLCCYIKMGLTSKDIAPLLNITVKSVEMARYRLRKKIELSPDISLTDYLTKY